jgi:hypothetical protein
MNGSQVMSYWYENEGTRAGALAQEVEHLTSRHEALSSYLSTEREREREREDISMAPWVAKGRRKIRKNLQREEGTKRVTIFSLSFLF